jgi:hypothetical protein
MVSGLYTKVGMLVSDVNNKKNGGVDQKVSAPRTGTLGVRRQEAGVRDSVGGGS